MNEKGFKDTQAEIKRFNTLIAAEYRKAMDEINRDIRQVYDRIIGGRSYSEVAQLLKEQSSWLYAQANKFDRLQSLQKKIQTEYIKASIKAGNMTVEASKTAITNNFYRQQYSIAFASDIQLSFSVLNPKVVEVSVLGTPRVWKTLQAKVLKSIEKKYGNLTAYQAKYGGTLSSLLAKNRKVDIAKLQSALNQGLIQGKSYTKTVKDIKTVLKSSTYQAMRVVRTESNRNMNAGAYAAHNVALSEGLELTRVILATLDSRTREQSQRVDDMQEDENGMFHYPGGVLVEFPGNTGNPAWDINDRETVIETLEGERPEQRTGRNPLTGESEIMNYTDYDNWMSNNGMAQNGTGRWMIK